MKIIRWIGLGIVCILPWKPCMGQYPTYLTDRYSIEHGLSQSVVKTLFQDSKGFLWIGTQEGLNRFDGYQFIDYRYDPNDTNSISNNSINAIIEDPEGNLWIGTQHGLNLFENGKFRRIYNRSDPSALIYLNTITGLAADDSGQIWISTLGGGLQCYHPVSGVFRSYKKQENDPNSLWSNYLHSLYRDGQGVLWIGTSYGLCRYSKGRVERIMAPEKKYQGIFSDALLVIRNGSNRTLWVGGMQQGLMLYHPEDHQVLAHYTVQNGLKQNTIMSVYETPDQTLWIGTQTAGLHCLKDKQWSYFRSDPADPNKTISDEINTIIPDRSGHIWVGSDYGLYFLRKNRFIIYNRQAQPPYDLPGNDTWVIFEDSKKRLWIGVHPLGLVMKSGQQSTWFSDKANSPIRLPNPKVYCMTEDRYGRIWIGAQRGLTVLDGDQIYIFPPSRADSFGIPPFSLLSIVEDREGQIWLATYGEGLLRWQPESPRSMKGKFIRYKHNPDDPNSISNDDVFTLALDRDGFLWVGTFDGLNRFDGKQFIRYKHEPGNPNSLSHNTIFSICPIKDGSLWVGTDGGGLNHFTNNHWTIYTKKHGLANNVIYSIIEDADSNLWLSTNKGLTRFSLNPFHPHRIQNFDVHDGLPVNEFNQNSSFKNARGEIFFGSISGLVRFNPKDLDFSRYRAPVHITAFKIFDQETDRKLQHGSHIDLSYKDNFFSFEFVAIDFTTASKNQYAYQLVGFDKDWIYTGTRRYASYTNLDGGEYIFRVKATNSHGVWNDTPTEVYVRIHPPFWATWWFRVLFILTAVAGLYGIYRYRMLSIRRRNEELELKVLERTKTIEEKNRELEEKNRQIQKHQAQLIESEKLSSLGRLVSSMSHEINNPLNFTIGTISLLEQDLEEMKMVLRESPSASFSTADIDARIELLNAIKTGIQRISDIVVGMRNFSVMNESELVEVDINTTLNYLLSLIRSRDRQGVMIHADLSEVPVIRGLPGQLNHAILNVLKNAIEFTQKRVKRDETGNVWIRTYQEKDMIVISIRDDGIGIAEEHRGKIFEPFFTTKGVGEGTGLGLAISYSVIQHHQGRIECHSEPGKGSEFKLYLPVNSQEFPSVTQSESHDKSR